MVFFWIQTGISCCEWQRATVEFFSYPPTHNETVAKTVRYPHHADWLFLGTTCCYNTKDTPLEGRNGELEGIRWNSLIQFSAVWQVHSFTQVCETRHAMTPHMESHCLWQWRAYHATRFGKCGVYLIFNYFRLYGVLWGKTLSIPAECSIGVLCIIMKLQRLIFFCLDLLQTAILNINKLRFLLPQQLHRQEHWNTWTAKKRTVSAHKSQSTILQDGGNMDNSPNMKPLVRIQSMFPYSWELLQSVI